MRKKTQFLLNLVLTLVFLVLIVFQGPNLNPMYPDGAFSWCFIISCYVILNFFVALGSVRITTNEYNRPQLSVDKSVGGYKTGFALLPSSGSCTLPPQSSPCPCSITRFTGTSWGRLLCQCSPTRSSPLP